MFSIARHALSKTGAAPRAVVRPAARALSAEGLEGFGRHKFMGDVADEFLAEHGMAWAELEDGTWTKDPAKADKARGIIRLATHAQCRKSTPGPEKRRERKIPSYQHSHKILRRVLPNLSATVRHGMT